MSVIKQIGVTDGNGSRQMIDIGAKAENVIMANGESLETVITELKRQLNEIIGGK